MQPLVVLAQVSRSFRMKHTVVHALDSVSLKDEKRTELTIARDRARALKELLKF